MNLVYGTALAVGLVSIFSIALSSLIYESLTIARIILCNSVILPMEKQSIYQFLL